MFDDWKKLREIERSIARTKKEHRTLNQQNDPDADQRNALQKKLNNLEHSLQIIESQRLLRKARRRLIEVPRRRERPTWWDSDQDEEGGIPEYAVTYWLSETGKIGVARLIRTDTRQTFDLWLKIIVALTGLGGALIGILFAFKQRCP